MSANIHDSTTTSRGAPSTPPRDPTAATPLDIRKPFLNSPIAKTENSSQVTVLDNTADARYLRLAEEIRETVVGPMPPEMFTDFLPEPSSVMPPFKGAFDKVPKKGKEPKMNQPIVMALNKAFAVGDGPRRTRCPGFTFYNTGDNRETIYHTKADKYNSKYDVTGYFSEFAIEGDVGTEDDGDEEEDEEEEAEEDDDEYEDDDEEEEEEAVEEDTDEDQAEKRVCEPGRAQIVVEVKTNDFAQDPDLKNPKFIICDHLKGEEKVRALRSLGQQVSYATEVCARQHRNFLFTIFMARNTARFLRWDRAGVIISESFNYRKNPEILCRFLWRFGNATDAQRGCDTTVSVASPTEELMFKNAIESHVKSQLGNDFDDLDAEYERHYKAQCVIKIPVRNFMRIRKPLAMVPGNSATGVGGQSLNATPAVREDSGGAPNEFHFLASRPVVIPRSIASRATRGYWAVNTETGKVVFLKDAWRTNVARMEIEGDILRSLKDQQVRNVPTLVCYGDVGDVSTGAHDTPAYLTQTDQYKNANWNDYPSETSRLTSRIHYRQAVAEAGYTMERLAGTKELLQGARDVYRALRDAYLLCMRMHRDLSSTNFILFGDSADSYPARRCILIDWELSCEVKDEDAREHWRTGTWAFMSLNTLIAPEQRRPHELCDDAESLVYVVFYCALFCLPWKYMESRHQHILEQFFNQWEEGDNDDDSGSPTGGVGKRANLFDGYYFHRPGFTEPNLRAWLEKTLKPMAAWNHNPVESTAEAQINATHSLFDYPDEYYAALPSKDRDFHKRPAYKGHPLNIFPATESSGSNQVNKTAKRKASTSNQQETDSKRSHTAAAVPPEPEGSSSSRNNTNIEVEGRIVTRAQKKKSESNFKSKSTKSR